MPARYHNQIVPRQVSLSTFFSFLVKSPLNFSFRRQNIKPASKTNKLSPQKLTFKLLSVFCRNLTLSQMSTLLVPMASFPHKLLIVAEISCSRISFFLQFHGVLNVNTFLAAEKICLTSYRKFKTSKICIQEREW